MTVTAISMITVPATVGVMRRLSSDSREASRNWKSAEAATSVASMPGPPCASAATDTAMKAPDVPISRMYPAPKRPNRLACTIVVMPLTRSAAEAAHDRKSSRLAGRAHHDRDGEHDGPHGEQAVLRREPGRDGVAGFLVGLEADSGAGSAGLLGHCAAFLSGIELLQRTGIAAGEGLAAQYGGPTPPRGRLTRPLAGVESPRQAPTGQPIALPGHLTS